MDAIALHTTATIALHKQTVVKVCAFGVAADFRGPNLNNAGMISWDLSNALNEMFPRLDLANGIRRILCGFCRTKPQTTFGQCIPSLVLLCSNRLRSVVRMPRGHGVGWLWLRTKRSLTFFDILRLIPA